MKEKIESMKAPAAIGPYSQAVNNGGLVFVSGQLSQVLFPLFYSLFLVVQVKQQMQNRQSCY